MINPGSYILVLWPPIFRWWADPRLLERKDADGPEAADTSAALGVSDGELGDLYGRMIAHHMITG